MAAVSPTNSKTDWGGGALLFAGGTDWERIGRSIGKTKKDAVREGGE